MKLNINGRWEKARYIPYENRPATEEEQEINGGKRFQALRLRAERRNYA